MANLLDNPFEGINPPGDWVTYDPNWSKKPPEDMKLLHYLADNRLVPVGRGALDPGKYPKAMIITQQHIEKSRDPNARRPSISEHINVFRVNQTTQFVARVDDVDEQTPTKIVHDGHAEENSEARRVNDVITNGNTVPGYNVIDADQVTMILYFYPRGYITAWCTKPATRSGRSDQWRGFRLCTTQLAVEIYHKIINADIAIHLLPTRRNGFPWQTTKNNVSSEAKFPINQEVQDNAERFQVCAQVDVDLWVADDPEIRFRRVSSWHVNDDLVVAYFWKDDDESSWKQIGPREFGREEPHLTPAGRSTWIFRMDKNNETVHDQLGLGGGTMYVSNAYTRETYYVLDPDFILEEHSLHEKDTVQRTFGGNWVLVEPTPLRDPKLSLYAQISEKGVILDRVVMKRFFSARMDDMGKRECERKIQKWVRNYTLMQIVANDNPSLKVRGFAVRGDKERRYDTRYSFFLEYCPKGNMRSVVKDFKKREAHLSEGFIWLLFLNLVKLCKRVESLGLVHKKLTLRNILLRHKPEEGKWRAYPSPAVGSFSKLDRIKDVRSSGVEGFLTPEHIRARFNGRKARVSGNPRTKVDGSGLHVFAIGICIWSAMRLSKNGLPPEQQDFRRRKAPLPFHTTDPIDQYSIYSVPLEKLVQLCLKPLAEQRPSLKQLGRIVTQRIKDLKTIKPNVDGILEEGLPLADRVRAEEDFFRIGANYLNARDEYKKSRRVGRGVVDSDDDDGYIDDSSGHEDASEDSDDLKRNDDYQSSSDSDDGDIGGDGDGH